MGSNLDRNSVRVRLNGKDITNDFRPGTAVAAGQTEGASLTISDGLRAGSNRIVATARGYDRHIEARRVKFDYYSGLHDGQTLPHWLPSAVGLNLTPGGAQPWVTMTTGTPAGLQDNSDQTVYSLPYPDSTFPTTNDTPCTTRYQIVVLNRLNPAQEDAYMCPADAGTLKQDLAGLAKGAEIVLVGTTWLHNADAGLDTTSIGGTNYSNYSASWQPLGYAAIGVSGAAAGSAYEDFYLPTEIGWPYTRIPFATGMLAQDENSNYNFHAGGKLQFEIYPNSVNGSTALFINYNGLVVPWLPPAGSANGFWLIEFDRRTLLPDENNGVSCGASGNCGQFFQTGSTDPSVASFAIHELATHLAGQTNRQLIFLMTSGQPFQSASAVTAELVSAMQSYGASAYALQSLTTPNSTYTLVAAGLVGATSTASLTPFSQGVVNSSSAFSQQGQTGFVRGVMTRDNNGGYGPAVVSQEDGSGNQQGATILSVDYDFYTISSQNPIDWTLTDTPGHIAAYHYLSAWFLARHFQSTGPHSQDLRYFYAGNPTQVGQYNTDFLCATNPSCPAYPGDGYGFTVQDLTDAEQALYNETTALNDTDGYLGESGLKGVIDGTAGGTVVADVVMDAASEVLNGQVGATDDTGVNGASFDWMNLLAGITSIGAAALGPLDLPVAAAAIGVTSGILWSGSAEAPWATNDPDTPPSDENTFDTTLGNLEQNASTYAENLITSYDAALDGIYSDWGKLSATGAKTANTDSGWRFDNQLSGVKLGKQLANGVRRAMYLQVLPQFYWMDSYSAQPVSTLDKVGTFYSWGGLGVGQQNNCNASYPSTVVNDNSIYRIFPSPSSPGKTDMFVMGGTINSQGTPKVHETFPTDTLLTTLFGQPDPDDPPTVGPLGIPAGLVYGPSVLPSRPGGPTEGTYDGVFQCYRPGCSDVTDYPHQSKCINP